MLAVIQPKEMHAQSKIEWHSFEDAIKKAESTNKPIFIDVWAPWCGWCHKMNKEVYPDVKKELHQNYVLTKLNRDDNSKLISYKGRKITSLKLAQKLNTEMVPSIVILSSEGDYLTNISGYIEAEKLTSFLDVMANK